MRSWGDWRTPINSVSERYSSLRVQSMMSPVRMANGDRANRLCQVAERARAAGVALTRTKPYRCAPW